MKILWLSWKDHKHPQAGGAEVVKAEFCKRLAADGHEVIIFTARYQGSSEKSNYQGYKIIRIGSRYTVYWHAWRYYRSNLKGWADLVIDEVNTIPFFANLYVKEHTITLIYQLCREIWFYQMRLPFSLIGYLAEPLYLRLLHGTKVITESKSTKNDLIKHGFSAQDIKIFSLGLQVEPIKKLNDVKKYNVPTLLSLSAIRPMKRTLHQIKAFELAKLEIPNLQLKVAGDAENRYGRKVLNYISNSKYSDDIEYLGKVNQKQKIELMQKCHYILSTAVKEGWGLTITEAASQGTPAIVYDADGLRDSVIDNKTGYISSSFVKGLADKMVITFAGPAGYQTLRKNAWQWSKTMTLDKSYLEFKKVTNL